MLEQFADIDKCPIVVRDLERCGAVVRFLSGRSRSEGEGALKESEQED